VTERREHPLTAAYAGIFLFIIGIALGVGALEVNRRESARRQGWQRADGIVVEMLRGSPSNPRLKPLVAFTTSSGERVSFTPQPDTTPQPLNARDHVAVLYRADDPTMAVVDRPGVRRLRSIAAGAASLGLMTLGGYVAWYAKRRAGL